MILQVHLQPTLYGGASKHTSIFIDNLDSAFLLSTKKNIYLYNKFKNHERAYFPPSNVLCQTICALILMSKYSFKVVHSHHRRDFFLALGLKIFGLRHVHTLHGIYSAQGLYLSYLKKTTLVAISEYVKSWHIKNNGMSDSVEVIYNGVVDLGVLASQEELEFDITWIGTLELGVKRPNILKKHLEHILEKGLRVAVVGSGSYLKELEKIQSPYLTLTGYSNDVGGIIAKSRFVWSTALEEGLGRTLIEAFSLSTPVIGMGQGGAGEIICDGINGFAMYDDNTENLLKILYNSEKSYHKLSANARKSYEDKFTIAEFISRYSQKYADQF
jgi:glycosyltransferase involved in cell wall biosynthesis